MSCNFYTLKRLLLPVLLFILTALVAIFARQSRDWLLPVMFLLLPFSDFFWRMPHVRWEQRLVISYVILAVIVSVLLFQHTEVLDLFTIMVLVAALPEEWFFRAYLQKRIGNNISAVLIVSLLFSSMHYLTHDSAVVWLVFIPSVFFGWIYKKTDDLILIVMLHALSNLVYYIYLEAYAKAFFGR